MTNNRIVSSGCSIFGISGIHTANPIRVAIDELQLHDLQNIEAIHRIQHTKWLAYISAEYLQWMCSRTRDRLRTTSRLFQIRPLGAKTGGGPFYSAMGSSAVNGGSEVSVVKMAVFGEGQVGVERSLGEVSHGRYHPQQQ